MSQSSPGQSPWPPPALVAQHEQELRDCGPAVPCFHECHRVTLERGFVPSSSCSDLGSPWAWDPDLFGEGEDWARVCLSLEKFSYWRVSNSSVAFPKGKRMGGAPPDSHHHGGGQGASEWGRRGPFPEESEEEMWFFLNSSKERTRYYKWSFPLEILNPVPHVSAQ